MKRIDACLAERLHQAQQAQAGTSNAPAPAGAKGKGHQLTPEEIEDQLNKLKEQELRCKAMRQAIRDHLVMMQPLRQDHSHQIWGRPHVPRPGNAVPNRGSGTTRVVDPIPAGSRPDSSPERTRPGVADSYHIGDGGTEQRENGEERYNGCGCSMRLQRPVTQR